MHRFAKYCWFVLFWTVLVILWGAFVRATGSGAGCGNHWPTCNGVIIPQPKEIETAIEFFHRLLSGVALILIFVMLIWGWKVTKAGYPARKGIVASAVFIVTESMLGAGLVLFGLVTTNQSLTRAIVMAFHLLNTFFLLAAISLSAYWASGGNPISLREHGRKPLVIALALTGVALVGMTGAITALGDTLFPATSLAHGIAQETDPNAHFLIRLRVYHPAIAILAGAIVIFAVRYFKTVDISGRYKNLGKLLLALVFTQWAMGIVNVILLAPVTIQILHLLIADLIWISLVLFSATQLGYHPLIETTNTSVEVT